MISILLSSDTHNDFIMIHKNRQKSHLPVVRENDVYMYGLTIFKFHYRIKTPP